jgi:hypothetical protein
LGRETPRWLRFRGRIIISPAGVQGVDLLAAA